MQRILSAYEFAAEVASRHLRTLAPPTLNPQKVDTRNVWPWSQLVPFLERDFRQRVSMLQQSV